MLDDKVVILGGGPAGLSCAHTLSRANQQACIIEKNTIPGGLSRTIDFHGYLFDIGGHRFLSRSEEINALWHEVLGEHLLRVKRLSRIYYRKKYFNYPLTFLNTFWNLGLIESFLCVASYARYIIFKPADNNTFEGWVANHFGKRLFEIFFKSYTEKVWAMSSKDISADWAKERIKGLSLRVAIKQAIFKTKKHSPKTLAEEFLYPKTGPGEFYNRLAHFLSNRGSQLYLNKRVTRVRHDSKKILSVAIEDCLSRQMEEVEVRYLFSSIPLPSFIKHLDPLPPAHILAAAEKLRFRHYLVVNVILNKENIFPDQWIYVHSPDVKLGRIQNYKNWSPHMVVDAKKTSLGLEYFCSLDDALWKMNDIDLIEYALEELEKTGIVSRQYLIDGFVVREENAYPIYSLDYHTHRDTIKEYLAGFSNFQAIGRSGLFCYGNSDYALLTGIYAARNFLRKGNYNLWEKQDSPALL